ncbi:chlorophyllide reductase [Rhizobium sp. AN80A]|uniref:chlorophyllide reductase n=1 Tax=Rhizobium sp. AN80A TaxID=3040673 RepID=UPI0024B37294|nr:chlorophyllide reductase [Rhizobium sp. AN80A]
MTITTLASCLVLVPAHAEQSTNAGAISVAQVTRMLDQAPTNRTAQQVLTAYLSGVGEAAGVVVDLGGAPCQRPLTLTTEEVRRAIATAPAGVQGNQIAATPLVVRDMLVRAGCRRKSAAQLFGGFSLTGSGASRLIP